MHSVPGGALKAEAEHSVKQTSTKKTTSNSKSPVIRGDLLNWIAETQACEPVPNTMVRSMSVRAIAHYKCKDYLCFFLTLMAMAIPKLKSCIPQIPRRKLYTTMIAALHMYTLLYLAYDSPEYVTYIHAAGDAYVKAVLLYHGVLFASYGWHSLAHTATDVARHGPSVLCSTFGSEMMFKRVRDVIKGYHQQTTSLINKRHLLLNIHPVTFQLKRGRWSTGVVVHKRHEVTMTPDNANQYSFVLAEIRKHSPECKPTFYRQMN